MKVEEWIDKGNTLGFQPYYLCYLFVQGYPIEYQLTEENNFDYIDWINSMHKKFRPFAKYFQCGSGKYHNEFMVWLKDYVTKEIEK